jgi:hypothetical protein
MALICPATPKAETGLKKMKADFHRRVFLRT